jgi:hypothetical protein
MTYRKHSKDGGYNETVVTTLKVMAADRPCVEFYDFYSVSLEYFGYHHIAV